MRKSETEIEVLTLNGRLETNAFDLEIFCKTLAHAHDHVVHESARKSVQCFDRSRLGAAHERKTVVLHARFDCAWQFPVQLALRSFDRNAAVIVNIDFDFVWNADGFVSDSRHKNLPNVGEQFAADLLFLGFSARHHAARG